MEHVMFFLIRNNRKAFYTRLFFDIIVVGKWKIMAKLSSRSYKEEVEKVMELLKAGKPLVLYDLETTGLKSATSKILSCSAIKVRYEDGMFKEVGVNY